MATRITVRGRWSSDGKAVTQRRIGRNAGPAVDPKRLALARDQEHEGDAGVADDVAQAVDPVIAPAVGDGEGTLVQHPHEAGRIAAR